MKAELRDILWERCDGRCEACGRGMMPDYWAVHHRKLRSQGRDDSPANLVAVHHACHNLTTGAIHFEPSQSYERGLMVRGYENPAEIPLFLPGGRAVLLSETYEEYTDDPPSTDRGETAQP